MNSYPASTNNYDDLKNAKSLLQALGLDNQADAKDSLPLYNRLKGQSTKQQIDNVEIDWFKNTPQLHNKGYLIYRVIRDGIMYSAYEHRLVWESHFGPISRGYEIHHIDFNRQNNDITNLQLLTNSEHRRLHGGYKQVNGIAYKKCGHCQQYLELSSDNYYFRHNKDNTPASMCKKCMSETRKQKLQASNGTEGCKAQKEEN